MPSVPSANEVTNSDGVVVCTAQRDGSGDLPNPLFTPPCTCPECAQGQDLVVEVQQDTIWVPVAGRPVRFDVDRVSLGDVSSRLL